MSITKPTWDALMGNMLATIERQDRERTERLSAAGRAALEQAEAADQAELDRLEAYDRLCDQAEAEVLQALVKAGLTEAEAATAIVDSESGTPQSVMIDWALLQRVLRGTE